MSTLTLPGVVPVALIVSTVAALFMTPIAAWHLRTGVRNLCIFVPVLWVALAAYTTQKPNIGEWPRHPTYVAAWLRTWYISGGGWHTLYPAHFPAERFIPN